MRKVLVIFLVIFSSLAVQAQQKLPKDFQKLLERANLSFDAPAELIETEVIDNYQMSYQYALKYPDEDFEVRYSINPLDDDLKAYEETMKKEETIASLHPNDLCKSALYAIIFNVSDGKASNEGYTEFPKESVKKEFHADWGAMAMVEAGETFGQDYQYCMIVAIHKDNLADAYYFYLGNEPERFSELMLPMFYTMTFE